MRISADTAHHEARSREAAMAGWGKAPRSGKGKGLPFPFSAQAVRGATVRWGTKFPPQALAFALYI